MPWSRPRRDHRGITERSDTTGPQRGAGVPGPSPATGQVLAPPGTPSAPPCPKPPGDAKGPPPPPPSAPWGEGQWWPTTGWRRHGRQWRFGPPGFGPHSRRSLHGPWVRTRDDRLFAGVAGGLAKKFGVDATLVRIAFVIATLAAGVGLPIYVAAWLLMPLEGHETSIGAKVAKDRHGILLALAFLPLTVATMVLGSALGAAYISTFAWPVFLCAAGGVLVWRNSDPDERAWLREAADPVVRLGTRPERSWRRAAVRGGLAVALLVLGLSFLLAHHARPIGPVRAAAGALLVLAAVVVIFGPWWLRLVRELVAERQARIRAEDRAEMASRVHDSVLQTLALIQRAAKDPQKVVQLARAQERELRAWLFDGDIPGALGQDVTSVAAGAQAIGGEVEEAHGVPVDVVTVGDCPLDGRLRELLDAAREATVNAAKWSGAPRISLFAEVEPGRVSVFVRDRGRGFDLDAVAADRHGVAESIQARMLRHGGRATVRTAPGEGTEVELVMPRAAER